MKTKILQVAALAAMATVGMTFTGCKSKLQVVAQQPGSQRPPTFNGQTNIPCVEYDTDEYYTGYGSFYGSYTQVSLNVNDAMRRARTNLIEKIAHEYDGFVEQTAGSAGNNRGNDQVAAIKSAGLEIITKEVGRLRVTCSTADETVDVNGNVTVHVGIRMNLADIAKALLEQTPTPKDNLTKDERDFAMWQHEQTQAQLQKYLSEKKALQNK
ncbi:MAG: hypothetical protein FWC39_13730 [Bacteroidetes bacterium]|nr:hypothetical protein [Bacteroidota bacterium]